MLALTLSVMGLTLSIAEVPFSMVDTADLERENHFS